MLCGDGSGIILHMFGKFFPNVFSKQSEEESAYGECKAGAAR